MEKIIRMLVVLAVFLPGVANSQETYVTFQTHPHDQGLEIFYYNNGEEIAKEFVDESGRVLKKKGKVPNGKVQTYTTDGKIKEEYEFHNNSRNGQHREYHENGEIKFEGIYKNDKLQGEFRSYSEAGIILSEGVLEEGGSKGSVRLYGDDGKLELEEVYVNGELRKTREFFQDGTPKSEWAWKGGLFNGFCRSYYPNGQIASLDTYKEGRIRERVVWDEEGRMKFQKKYDYSGNEKM